MLEACRLLYNFFFCNLPMNICSNIFLSMKFIPMSSVFKTSTLLIEKDPQKKDRVMIWRHFLTSLQSHHPALFV